MTSATWLSFGPDLEPLESESRRRAEAPGPREDGLLVSGEVGEIADILAEACASKEGWCRLDRVVDDGGHEPVHVQARLVRWVSPAGDRSA